MRLHHQIHQVAIHFDFCIWNVLSSHETLTPPIYQNFADFDTYKSINELQKWCVLYSSFEMRVSVLFELWACWSILFHPCNRLDIYHGTSYALAAFGFHFDRKEAFCWFLLLLWNNYDDLKTKLRKTRGCKDKEDIACKEDKCWFLNKMSHTQEENRLQKGPTIKPKQNIWCNSICSGIYHQWICLSCECWSRCRRIGKTKTIKQYDIKL